MSFKISSPTSSSSLNEQLERLYARRSALEDLIRSLERYSHCSDAPASRKGVTSTLSAPSKATLAS